MAATLDLPAHRDVASLSEWSHKVWSLRDLQRNRRIQPKDTKDRSEAVCPPFRTGHPPWRPWHLPTLAEAVCRLEAEAAYTPGQRAAQLSSVDKGPSSHRSSKPTTPKPRGNSARPQAAQTRSETLMSTDRCTQRTREGERPLGAFPIEHMGREGRRVPVSASVSGSTHHVSRGPEAKESVWLLALLWSMYSLAAESVPLCSPSSSDRAKRPDPCASETRDTPTLVMSQREEELGTAPWLGTAEPSDATDTFGGPGPGTKQGRAAAMSLADKDAGQSGVSATPSFVVVESLCTDESRPPTGAALQDGGRHHPDREPTKIGAAGPTQPRLVVPATSSVAALPGLLAPAPLAPVATAVRSEVRPPRAPGPRPPRAPGPRSPSPLGTETLEGKYEDCAPKHGWAALPTVAGAVHGLGVRDRAALLALFRAPAELLDGLVEVQRHNVWCMPVRAKEQAQCQATWTRHCPGRDHAFTEALRTRWPDGWSMGVIYDAQLGFSDSPNLLFLAVHLAEVLDRRGSAADAEARENGSRPGTSDWRSPVLREYTRTRAIVYEALAFCAEQPAHVGSLLVWTVYCVTCLDQGYPARILQRLGSEGLGVQVAVTEEPAVAEALPAKGSVVAPLPVASSPPVQLAQLAQLTLAAASRLDTAATGSVSLAVPPPATRSSFTAAPLIEDLRHGPAFSPPPFVLGWSAPPPGPLVFPEVR